MNKNNKRGIIENGIMVILITIISTVASTGILFGGGNPFGAAFFLGSSAAIAYSQQDYIVDPFRENRAVEICEFNRESDCATKVSSMTKEEILSYIKDDTLNGTGFYAPQTRSGNGGNFVGGYMN